MEIEKFISVSINDFIPSNMQDYQLHFDELGILKQSVQIKQKSASTSSGAVTSTSPNSASNTTTFATLNSPTAAPSSPIASNSQLTILTPSKPPLPPPPPPLPLLPQEPATTPPVKLQQQVSQTAQPQIVRLGLKSVNEEQGKISFSLSLSATFYFLFIII